MEKETFVNQFNKKVALINENNNATAFKNDQRVSNAFDDLSQALGLTHQAVALLVWALNHMNGEEVNMSSVATQIDYSEQTVSSAMDELEKHHYMVEVDGRHGCLDLTSKTKNLITNHYCFYKLLNC
jgi:DNA-binding MarR family transcriptional regulator